MWNHQIDANLIYVALKYACKGYIDKAIKLLFEFEQWKFLDNNEQNYNKKMDEFLERRCCNHNVNLFCIFFSEKYKNWTAFEHAELNIVNNGLPFVGKDKKT
ncbi:hypothetical protein RFI_36279 [Reticulomyxa filosa]|uniref:Uncharacterized protein n=1 Tax=Reticulomyxa filosa TaxID=46433 RepID=X6LIF2_RETFI|nr:hypothetical protein RFI_36279 [Reticulomyxa filosa]|eukprot:ETO01161.1 hypothetical protein RFI_36279 [Reticulomyxa filosa]